MQIKLLNFIFYGSMPLYAVQTLRFRDWGSGAVVTFSSMLGNQLYRE